MHGAKLGGQSQHDGDELLVRARAGETAAFAELVRLHRRSVYGIALRMLNQRETAEDLAQEVFLELHRRLFAIESMQHLIFWLRRVTTHRAIDQLRHEAVAESPLQGEEALHASEQSNGDVLLHRQLHKLVSELPPAARAVMLLRYQEDLDPIDIARTLDMPVNTVKSHLKRSLAAMRQRMVDASPELRQETHHD